ncbi:P27 family phage terminase small subunit [Clostridium botulinum]|uniref:P27 family phage terminase small subunit n=3 Tax=Clostridium botulinum TaxID=1491 RepID=A0A6M0SSP3_CLOBO|nr:P27 family phage terminase small subunit [Clostridium botulinum]NFA43376.1 P27 family phage terminase small subunit [Clostridium botulinum]NFO35135.1 P27 family phage terminase small subunit [Clostridium botulinum]NFO48387.1 P27 family phage terminase small subunit [Clostridium botulinum]NFO58642.1 P27 family phage terminase small subunit [Clostridium botulinum]
MARPSKSVNVISKNLTKEEKEIRQSTEQKLKGKADKIKPPSSMPSSQKKIFKFIVNELKESKILSNLDVPMLVTVSRAIDRLNYIESEIDNDITLLTDTSFMSTKDKYTKDLYRCCNELCLSPQSRAKMGNIALDNENKKQDPLAQIMEGVNDED